MKRFLIIGITYNSYDCLNRYIKSIDEAASEVTSLLEVDVVIGDASTLKKNINLEYNYIRISKFDIENLGYFGGVDKCIEIIGKDKVEQFDYVAISNVDLALDKTFFKVLLSTKLEERVGWIAPNIFTPSRGSYENPMRISRYNKKEIKLNILFNKYPILSKIYQKSFRKLVLRKRQSASQNENYKNFQEIYCGHGAFFLFTKSLARVLLPFGFPCFLYSEELFVAEKTIENNFKVLYCPTLHIENTEANVSTSKLKNTVRNQYKIDSLNYILKAFF